jgi:MYXO-CTERM domain-containing protein
MNKLPQKLLLSLSAVVSTLLLTGSLTGHVARADVGPMDPARAICMGSSAGSPCVFEGKKGTCEGPHPSRMYCTPSATPAKPVKPKPVDPATPPTPPTPPITDPATPPTPNPTPTPTPIPTNVEPAKPMPAPVLPTTPAKPPRKSGCAVSSAQSLPAPLTLIGVVLGLGWITRRRRASRIGA